MQNTSALVPRDIYNRLMPFQRQFLRKAYLFEKRVLLADDMGLGKTIQSLAFLSMDDTHYPVLIICPVTVKYMWEEKIHEWLGDNIQVQVISGREITDIYAEVVIINYDVIADTKKRLARGDALIRALAQGWKIITIVTRKNKRKVIKKVLSKEGWGKRLEEYNWSTLILDESHYIKNNTSERTKATVHLSKGISNILALSGTPIENRPIEIWTTINMLYPGLFKNRWYFAKRYCDLKHGKFGWDMTGSARTDELHHILVNNLMVRRRKKEVLKELPDKVVTEIPMDITTRSDYDFAKSDFLNWIKKNKPTKSKRLTRASRAQALAQIEYLKQIIFKGKLPYVIQWIEDFLASGEKLIVFAIHTEFIITLAEHFKGRCLVIDGSVSASERREVEKEFQTNNKYPLFIGQLKAAGVGITLTASAYVAHLELGWNPALHVQGSDRAHRISQERQVSVYYILGKDTIEEPILELLKKKQAIVDNIIDGGLPSEEFDMLTNLLKEVS